MIEFDTKKIVGWTRLGMRKAFGEMMQEIAETHDDIVVMAADVASSANLGVFEKKYPQRFFNIGIAEQNMVAIAAGMAKEGKNVFVTSFAPFAALRPFEAIRTLLGYMRLNVKVVALASGISLGTQGYTHFCIEDIALMRTIPGLLILSPADCTELAKCLEFLSEYNGPAYLRLTGIDGSPSVYRGDYDFSVGKAIALRDGSDVAIFSTGSVVGECVRASRAISQAGISCQVYDIHTLKPFDKESLLDACEGKKLIVSVEEHTILGGLGGIIAEILAETEHHPQLIRIGVDDIFPEAGNYAYLLSKYGFTAQKIKDTILGKIKEI